MALLMAVMNLSLTACGDDNDEPSGGDIVGTWECDISDGSMVTVSAYILTDAWAQITGDTEEVEIEYDTWRISDDKIISGNGETVKFKLKGNKLTLTPTSGIIIPLTFTRVSDSRINRYLN